MRAADTNILVRFLTADDPKQFEAATAFFRDTQIFISVTVLLELEWVLRRSYNFSGARISQQLRRLGGMNNVTLEDSERVAGALDLPESGLDFADALHVARAAECADFVTFDMRLARRGARGAAIPIVLLES